MSEQGDLLEPPQRDGAEAVPGGFKDVGRLGLAEARRRLTEVDDRAKETHGQR